MIIRKWSHNALPDEQAFSGRLEDTELGQLPSDNVASKILWILTWFVLPLVLLTIADRLWAWSQWVRKRNKKYADKAKKAIKDNNPLNKENRIMRKKIVAGNWKMNMNLQDGIALAKELNETLKADKPNCGVVICTPFIHLASIAQFLDQDIIGLGAENCADKEKGAFTGEVSAEMVKSTGAQYVILGHSERREYYKETPEILKEKVLLAQKNDLKVIFCIGESLEEREAGKQNEVVKAELEGSVFNLSEEDLAYSTSLRRTSARSSSPTSPSGLSVLARPLPLSRLRKSTLTSVRSSQRSMARLLPTTPRSSMVVAARQATLLSCSQSPTSTAV